MQFKKGLGLSLDLGGVSESAIDGSAIVNL